MDVHGVGDGGLFIPADLNVDPDHGGKLVCPCGDLIEIRTQKNPSSPRVYKNPKTGQIGHNKGAVGRQYKCCKHARSKWCNREGRYVIVSGCGYYQRIGEKTRRFPLLPAMRSIGKGKRVQKHLLKKKKEFNKDATQGLSDDQKTRRSKAATSKKISAKAICHQGSPRRSQCQPHTRTAHSVQAVT